MANTQTRSLSPKQTITWIVVGALGLMWWMTLSKKSPPAAPSTSTKVSASTIPSQPPDASVSALPTRVERPQLEAANRDPFIAFAPPAPKPVIPKKPPAPITVAAAPVPQAVAAPIPPPLNLRFVGQAWLPSGERMIYAALGETPVELKVGANLPNGYQVTRIDDKAVSLTYPPLNYNAQMVLPEPPRYEIR
jgi:hypothetical protein